MSIYGDTTFRFVEAFKKELSAGSISVEMEVVTLIIDTIKGGGLYRLPHIRHKYKEFFCPWDGMLHRSEECNAKHYASKG